MHPEKFSDHAELHNYAERHGLEYLWEGTQAFERRKRTLPPEQFEICEARTHRGTCARRTTPHMRLTEPRRDRGAIGCWPLWLGLKKSFTSQG